MSIQQVSNALDALKEYPAVAEYIKSFDSNDGFMYTVETTEERKELQRKMEKLLDDGMHSGASWGYLMRMVKGVLNGVFTLEELRGTAARCCETSASPTTPDSAAEPLN